MGFNLAFKGLKVEADMWIDSYPEYLGYFYAGLLTSLVHYM
jgi:hypothetical protein